MCPRTLSATHRNSATRPLLPKSVSTPTSWEKPQHCRGASISSQHSAKPLVSNPAMRLPPNTRWFPNPTQARKLSASARRCTWPLPPAPKQCVCEQTTAKPWEEQRKKRPLSRFVDRNLLREDLRAREALRFPRRHGFKYVPPLPPIPNTTDGSSFWVRSAVNQHPKRKIWPFPTETNMMKKRLKRNTSEQKTHRQDRRGETSPTTRKRLLPPETRSSLRLRFLSPPSVSAAPNRTLNQR